MYALVIDDDLLIQKTLTRILEGLGATVSSAESSAAALRAIDGSPEPYDIIFCDLQMPDRDGVQTLRDLAERKVAAGIVLLSGHAKDILAAAENTARHHSLNVLGRLGKPIDRGQLMEFLVLARTPRRAPRPSSTYALLTSDDIQQGLSSDQFEIALQPKVSPKAGTVDGLEALVRWRHPVRGMVSPGEFIAVAEESGLVEDLTDTVMRCAVAAHLELREPHPDIPIAVNLSARSMTSLDLADRLLAAVQRVGATPSAFMFEVTESCVADNMAAFLETATRLRLMGFRLSIDDFGTGFSTLEQVRRLPVTELKIDRAFVNGATEDRRMRNILEASLALGRSLDLKCVCEGVETKAEWDLVNLLGTDNVQGYYVAKPMGTEMLIPWMSQWANQWSSIA